MSSEGQNNSDEPAQKQEETDGEWRDNVTPSGYVRIYRKVGRYAMSKMMHFVMGHITDDMAKVKSMPMREDDVLLLTYPKSGTNWTSEILKMLISGKAKYHEEYKTNEWIEMQSAEKLESLQSPRVLNSHLAVHDLPDQILEKRCKVVIVYRNPKDVCVSFYNHCKSLNDFGGTWGDFCHLFTEDKDSGTDGVYYSWFEFTKDAFEYANKHDFVHALNFEDLKKNSEEEIKRLAKFLEVEVSDKLANEIADKCSFSNLKKAAENVKIVRKLKNPKPETSKVHIFRKGEVADWKNWFTVTQNEKFDTMYNEYMKGCDIEIKFTN